MKDFLKTTQGKIIAGIGAMIVLLLATVIGLKLTQSPNTKEDDRLSEPSDVKKKEDAKSPYNLYSGNWYSDREDETEIVLEKDGTYTGTGWVNTGRYEFLKNNAEIEFKDSLDGIKTLKLKTIDGETVLFDEKYNHNFYHSKEQAQKSITDKKKNEGANKDLFKQKWEDVLTKAVWKNFDGTITIKFTYKNYEITSNGESETKDYVNSGIQILDETKVQYGASTTSMATYLSIREKDGKYNLKAPFISKDQEYNADVKSVELTQQGTTKSEGAKEKETVTESTDDKGNKIIKKEKVIEEKDGWE